MENKDSSNIQNQSQITYKDNATCPLKLKISFLITFCMMGIINHLGIFLILTGSRNLSYEFNKPSFMGVYTIATFICTLLTRVLNKRFLIKISHKQRISCLSFYLFFAYIAFSNQTHIHLVMCANQKGQRSIIFFMLFRYDIIIFLKLIHIS